MTGLHEDHLRESRILLHFQHLSQTLVTPIRRIVPSKRSVPTGNVSRRTTQLSRRARELGYELKPILQTVTMPDGEVVTVKPDGKIVNA